MIRFLNWLFGISKVLLCNNVYLIDNRYLYRDGIRLCGEVIMALSTDTYILCYTKGLYNYYNIRSCEFVSDIWFSSYEVIRSNIIVLTNKDSNSTVILWDEVIYSYDIYVYNVNSLKVGYDNCVYLSSGLHRDNCVLYKGGYIVCYSSFFSFLKEDIKIYLCHAHNAQKGFHDYIILYNHRTYVINHCNNIYYYSSNDDIVLYEYSSHNMTLYTYYVDGRITKICDLFLLDTTTNGGKHTFMNGKYLISYYNGYFVKYHCSSGILNHFLPYMVITEIDKVRYIYRNGVLIKWDYSHIGLYQAFNMKKL